MLTWVVIMGLCLCVHTFENSLMWALQTCALGRMDYVPRVHWKVSCTPTTRPNALLSPVDTASTHRKLTVQGGADYNVITAVMEIIGLFQES